MKRGNTYKNKKLKKNFFALISNTDNLVSIRDLRQKFVQKGKRKKNKENRAKKDLITH